MSEEECLASDETARSTGRDWKATCHVRLRLPRGRGFGPEGVALRVARCPMSEHITTSQSPHDQAAVRSAGAAKALLSSQPVTWRQVIEGSASLAIGRGLALVVAGAAVVAARRKSRR